jgi:hypothetical protein
MKAFPSRLALAAVALAALQAQGQTLYELIDRNGKVTYSEEAPKNFDGKVIRIDVNPNANTATLPKYREADKPRAAAVATDRAALRERVAQRRKALEEAQNNPAEEDVQWVANAGGGVRRVPTEAYQRRLAELERSLKEAQDELDAVEKTRR